MLEARNPISHRLALRGMSCKPSLPIIAVITSLVIGCKGEAQDPAPPPPTVSVAQPLVKTVTDWDEYTGRIEATDSVEVRARVNGSLNSIHFREGAIVKKGDLLFVIDPRPYEAALTRTQGDLAQAEARLRLATNNLDRTGRCSSPEQFPKRNSTREERKGSRPRLLFNRRAATSPPCA